MIRILLGPLAPVWSVSKVRSNPPPKRTLGALKLRRNRTCVVVSPLSCPTSGFLMAPVHRDGQAPERSGRNFCRAPKAHGMPGHLSDERTFALAVGGYQFTDVQT